MIPLIKTRKDRSAILRFLCNALNNGTIILFLFNTSFAYLDALETTVKLFVQQGGLAIALEIAATSKEFEENSSATVVTKNIVSVVKRTWIIDAIEMEKKSNS